MFGMTSKGGHEKGTKETFRKYLNSNNKMLFNFWTEQLASYKSHFDSTFCLLEEGFSWNIFLLLH